MNSDISELRDESLRLLLQFKLIFPKNNGWRAVAIVEKCQALMNNLPPCIALIDNFILVSNKKVIISCSFVKASLF